MSEKEDSPIPTKEQLAAAEKEKEKGLEKPTLQELEGWANQFRAFGFPVTMGTGKEHDLLFEKSILNALLTLSRTVVFYIMRNNMFVLRPNRKCPAKALSRTSICGRHVLFFRDQEPKASLILHEVGHFLCGHLDGTDGITETVKNELVAEGFSSVLVKGANIGFAFGVERAEDKKVCYICTEPGSKYAGRQMTLTLEEWIGFKARIAELEENLNIKIH